MHVNGSDFRKLMGDAPRARIGLHHRGSRRPCLTWQPGGSCPHQASCTDGSRAVSPSHENSNNSQRAADDRHRRARRSRLSRRPSAPGRALDVRSASSRSANPVSPAASSVDEERLRAVIREELAQLHVQCCDARGCAAARNPAADLQRREVVAQRIDAYRASGAITDAQMPELQAEIAKLDETSRKQTMAKLIRALNSGTSRAGCEVSSLTVVNRESVMRMKQLISIGVLVLGSSAALAGLVKSCAGGGHAEPDGSGSATGSMTTARFSKNKVEYIGCGVRRFDDGVGGIFVFGFCQASTADEVLGFCQTENPTLIASIGDQDDFSFITFSWDAAGECRGIGNSTQSFYIHK